MPIYMGIFDKPNVLDKNFRGGVKAKGYEGWIELQSAQIGVNRHITSQTGRGSNREASRPAVQEIVITKSQDDTCGHGGDTTSGPMESFSLNFGNITSRPAIDRA